MTAIQAGSDLPRQQEGLMAEDDSRSRLGVRIPPPIKRRLDLAALVQGCTATAVLTAVLDAHLPTDTELADQLRGGSNEH